MIGQIVFDDVKDTEDLTQRIQNKKTKLNVLQMKPILLSSVVGGYRGIDIDAFPNEQLLSLKVFVDTKDAMGANMLNTILEAVTAYLKMS